MLRGLALSVCVLAFVLPSVSAGQSTDAGYLGSSGASERALYVRRALESELAPGYVDPWSPVPAQGLITLTSDDALVVGIPLLQKSAMATIDTVDYVVNGNVISVHATREWYGAVTATIYPDNDYLLPIGELAAGDYRLDLRIDNVDRLGGTESIRSLTGFTDFRVVNVPEPQSIATILLGLMGLVYCTRHGI
jgi:hypothetical protein